MLAYPYPLYTGGVMPDERPTQPSTHVRVPPSGGTMAARIDADPRPGKVLVLPLDDYYQMPTTWGFFGVDSIANLLIQHPVVQRKPDGYFGDVPGFAPTWPAVETALLAGDLTAVPQLLDALGVRRVIVRHDLIRGLPNRYFADDRVLAAAMARVPGRAGRWTGRCSCGGRQRHQPDREDLRRVLDARPGPTAGAAVLGTVGTDRRWRRGHVRAADQPQVETTAAVAPDVVHWPVPAVTSGPPATTVKVARAGPLHAEPSGPARPRCWWPGWSRPVARSWRTRRVGG